MKKTTGVETDARQVVESAVALDVSAVRFLVIRRSEGAAHTVELQPGRPYRLGRSETNDLTLNDPQVSSFHARLEPDGEEFIIRDQESRNGTMVNGDRVRFRRLRVGDRLRLGATEVDYVKRLDPSELGTSAILSPRLSQPLLRNEVQRLRNLISQLTIAQQALEVRAPNEDIRQVGHNVARVVADLSGVENHLRCLICANHFHQLFHNQRSDSELYHDMLRYVASAIEAENGAFVLLEGAKARVVATIGVATLNWQFRLPEVFQFLIGRVMKEQRRFYTPSLHGDDKLARQFPEQITASDHRSVLIIPISTPEEGEVIGAAYFDNVHAPRQLRPQSSELVEGCLAIYARYQHREEMAGTQRRRLNEISRLQASGRDERREPTVCAE